jgi:PAS domain S-box-containing protein
MARERPGVKTPGADVDNQDLIQNVECVRNRLGALCSQLLEGGNSPLLAEIATSLREFQEVLERLQTRYGLLREALDQTSDSIYAKDLDGRYAMSNSTGAEMLGMTVEEVVGQKDTALFEAPDAERILATDREVMSAGEPRTFEETLHFQRLRKTLLTTKTPWHDSRGKLRGLIQTSQDITPGRRTAREAEARQHRLRGLASEIVMAEERLRRSLAAALHSGLGQDIALANIKLSRLRETAGAELRDPLTAIGELIEQADRSVRSITYRISPPSLHDLGLVPALDWLAEHIGRVHGLSVKIQDEGLPPVADERIRIILYRAVRELLVNAATHGGAREVLVRLAPLNDSLRITVEDDGSGFDTGDGRLGGYGLFGIREQLQYVGGDLDIDSARGRGTRVMLTSPFEAERPVVA